MPTIGIIGGGNVGANTAFFLAERDVANVILYDAQEGLAEGKALDTEKKLKELEDEVAITEKVDENPPVTMIYPSMG